MKNGSTFITPGLKTALNKSSKITLISHTHTHTHTLTYTHKKNHNNNKIS
jgi:hypothetical protein